MRNYVAAYVGTGIAFRGRLYRSPAEREQHIAVTTRWLIIAWLPIIPLSSWLVRVRSARVNDFSPNLYNYALIQRLPLHWRQISFVWLVTFTAFTAISFLLFHVWVN